MDNTPITFSIQHMDPLGQGVDKSGQSITFIAKTLPGEKGRAQLLKARKGVRFAQLEALEQAAENRVVPSCEHFSDCPACHYLHTDYQSELTYKKESLARALKKCGVTIDAIDTTPAPSRTDYRNRIQLHYRDEQLGLINSSDNSIVEIPHCTVIHPALRAALNSLYQQRSWLKQSSPAGHCELYLKDDQVDISWNKPYANGGFSQVNEAVNSALRTRVTQALTRNAPKSLLDLFCGNGNLSDEATATLTARRIMIDCDTRFRHPDFIHLDLLKNNALTKFRRQQQRHSFDALLLDPPRAGFKNLSQWVEAFTPKKIVYVSCAPATLARDLATVYERYRIVNVTLLDMFPGTYHFETLVELEAK